MNRKRLKALVVGFDYYGRYLTKLMNGESNRWRFTYRGSTRLQTVRAMIDALSADAVISFGGPGPNVALTEIARRRGIPVIVIWAGTDVTVARREPQQLEVIKRYGFTNISDGPWLVDELRDLGIEAEYVPVTAVEPPTEIAPLPKRFTVLTYLPEPRRVFYGEKAVYAIARELPDVPFRVVGRGERNPIAPPNVEFLGYVADMPARIDDSTVLLRLPEHDGKSMLVLEALARGRHVVWNYDFPAIHHAQRWNDAAQLLRAMKDAHEAGNLASNEAGYNFVDAYFCRQRIAGNLERLLDRATTQERVRADRRRVAISGLELFSAQVANELETLQSPWTAELLRTRARLEVATSMVTLATCDVWYSIGEPTGDRWLRMFARLLRKPRVIHWVGSDISTLKMHAGLQRYCRRRRVRNLAEVDWTIDELRDLGILAQLAPLPPRLGQANPLPLPSRFTVLMYLPKTRGEFYGRREYERLIRSLQHDGVRFLVVGGGELNAPPGAEVINYGWQTSLDHIYAEATVLLRYTKHDGLSLMTLEALTRGRYVLWTQDFPFTTRVQKYDDIENEVRRLLAEHRSGTLEQRTEAARYVSSTYSPDRCIPRIVSAWETASAGPVAGALEARPT